MNISVIMKNDLLGEIDSIISVSADKNIHFYDENNYDFCDIPFGLLEEQTSLGNKAIYQFFSLDESPTIRGTVTSSGVVKTFKIFGNGTLDNPLISGTVGSFTSSADMKFNKTSWITGMNIAISNLYLVIN
jgi:hypothetical protein